MIEFRGEHWTIPEVDKLSARLEDRVPAFVPAWQPGPDGPGRALLELTAHYVRLLADRLGRAPDKAKLAFLEALGVVAIPAQPARCPVVFELLPGAAHGTAPARARLGATVVNEADGKPLEFETESPIALAASRLMEVKALLPGDRYVDHTADVLGERSFKLFASPRAVPRELYLAHDRLFALTSGSRLDVEVEAIENSSHEMPFLLVWQYFDGVDWVPLVAPPSSASGGVHDLQRSGTLTFLVGEKRIAPTTIRGVKSHWIRATARPATVESLARASTDHQSRNVPRIDRFRARTVNAVQGFHVFEKKTTIVGPEGRKVAIRLVDANGTPLDPNRYEITRFRGAAIPKDQHGFLPIDSDETSLRLEITWDRPSGKNGRRSSLVDVDMPHRDRSYEITLARAGRTPEIALGNGLSLDLSTSFFPFGQLPAPGATFLFACAEVTSKPGASVTVFTEVSGQPAGDNSEIPVPNVRWEYWNGVVWATLPELFGSAEVLSFRQSGEVQFVVPANIAVKNELGQEKAWLRVHLVDGSYLVPNRGTAGSGSNAVTFDKVFPPVVRTLRLEYEFQSALEPLEHCLSFNQFQWEDLTTRVKFGGDAFGLFPHSAVARRTLFLGFSRTLPSDLISLFFNVETKSAQPETPLIWEYWDGLAWRTLTLKEDRTRHLSNPGLVQFIWPGTSLPDPEPAMTAEGSAIRFFDARSAARFRPGDEIAVFQDDDAELAKVASVGYGEMKLTAPLEKKATAPLVGRAPAAPFGTPRHWVRILWPAGAAPDPLSDSAISVRGIYLNAVWAEHARTQQRELLGSTAGTGGEAFDFAQAPVLPDEVIEVLELDGPLAEAGWASLAEELARAGRPGTALRREFDEKTGKVRKAWVRWESRPNFSASTATDRHYVVERTRGRVQFGDGRAGMLPPRNPNNILATYRSGGGEVGNIPARAIQVVLGSIPGAQRVINPIEASGGADGELVLKKGTGTGANTSAEPILRRGPQLVRHRYRALTALDYEQLALAASPGVAIARAITAADSSGAAPAGGVRVVVVPFAKMTEPEPMPSRELCRIVQSYLRARAPATAAGQIEVIKPTYLQIGVEAIFVPRAPDAAGLLAQRARLAVLKFLHPIAGGTLGQGWPFGADVHRSDLVAFLHRELGDLLAFVEQLHLLDHGVPAPEEITIPAILLPSAGPIRILLRPRGEVGP